MPQVLFSAANLLALAGWAVLVLGIILDRPYLRDRIAGLAIPLALALAYTVLIVIFWWSADGGFGTLADVQKLFTWPWIALAGWVHFLAYDLYIGSLLARRMMEARLSRLLFIPILPMAFLFGPIGFLMAQALILPRKEVGA